MAITKPPVLPAWADAGDKVQPSNAELSVGWPVSSMPPSRQRFNWVLNYVANAVRYFSRRGMPDYDAAETYMTGDRIIGDDGKTYRSLIDNNTAQTPSASPTKWERWGFTLTQLNAEMTTPAQFDNSTKLATTAFVKMMGMHASGIYAYSASQVLANSTMGGLCSYSGAVAGTFTLPALSVVGAGSGVLSFINCGNGELTVACAGTDTLVYGAGNVASIVLKTGDTMELISTTGGGWYVCGGSKQLGYSGAFGANLGTSGWRLLPSGEIEQWGTSSVATGTPLTVTLPTAFPTASYALVTGMNVPAGGANTSWATMSGLSQIVLNVAGIAGTNTVSWRVKGK